jgi:hypothetical protein
MSITVHQYVVNRWSSVRSNLHTNPERWTPRPHPSEKHKGIAAVHKAHVPFWHDTVSADSFEWGTCGDLQQIYTNIPQTQAGKITVQVKIGLGRGKEERRSKMKVWKNEIKIAVKRGISTWICPLLSLTYLLTPWSRVPLEKLTGFAASQEIPRLFGTRKFFTAFTSARHLSLSWADSSSPHASLPPPEDPP